MTLNFLDIRWKIFILLALVTGCQDPGEDCCNDQITVTIGEAFSIRAEETVAVENSIIDLTFTNVIVDTLCPEDVQCATQGTLSIGINVNGSDKTLSIGDINNPDTDFKDYKIELQKLIYPTKQNEKENTNSTYAVQMLITRN